MKRKVYRSTLSIAKKWFWWFQKKVSCAQFDFQSDMKMWWSRKFTAKDIKLNTTNFFQNHPSHFFAIEMSNNIPFVSQLHRRFHCYYRIWSIIEREWRGRLEKIMVVDFSTFPFYFVPSIIVTERQKKEVNYICINDH